MRHETCIVCGRRMPRTKGARADEARKYCSAGCRSQKLRPTDHALEQAIIDLLKQRARGKTICPSEAARAVLGDAGLEAAAMERTRCAARRLVAVGTLDILQRGQVVDPSSARGPIRLRLR